MSTSIGRKIVTDGLVIHYDALNGKSYPGSGITWNDLTSYDNDGDLDNGNTPVIITNGYASFTDTNNSEYVDISNIGEINVNTEYATVDMWVKLKPTSTTSGVISGYIFGWREYCIQVRYTDGEPTRFGFTTTVNDVYGLGSSELISLNLFNNWKHYSFVMCDSGTFSIPKTNQKIYINGVLQESLTQSGTENTNTRRFSFTSTSNARFPGNTAANGNNFLLNMDVAIIKVYNRELSQAEVTQNFNAHKGRFNIY